MTRRSEKTVAAPGEDKASAPANGEIVAAKPARPDSGALAIEDLANLILRRELRPRVGEIRRLAEALLRKKERKKAKKARKADAKGERKLSKIPARKASK